MIKTYTRAICLKEKKKMEIRDLEKVLDLHQKWLKNDETGIRANLSRANLNEANLVAADLRKADLSWADLSGADLSWADLSGADMDFSQLNLSCNGLNFKIDEKLAKQLTYHLINLIQYSNISCDIFNDNVYNWLEDSHLIIKYHLPILKKL